MIRIFTRTAAVSAVLLASFTTQAQADLCSGVGAAQTLAIGTTCVNTAYNVQQTWGTEIADPTCSTVVRDGWYQFTTSATQNFVTITATTNRNLGIAIYTGTCGALVEANCVDAGGGSVTEVLNSNVLPSTTYYVRLFRVNTGANNMTGNICITSPTFVSACSGTFVDNGGGGDYPANSNYTVTYCPGVAGQCVQAAFTAFNTESGYDFLTVYNGSTPLAAQLPGSPYSGTGSPGTLVAANPTGCLTFNFTSDGSVQRPGWSANISCVTCPPIIPASLQDCYGGVTVCADTPFPGNSSGSGSDEDLTAANQGCLSGENQSSWYYFSPTASGVVGLNIVPTNPSDDYDFAIWGPMSAFSCPPTSAPLRCSYSANPGTTGLNASAAGQNSEGSGGDGFVDVINVVAGLKYILLVDNYTSSNSGFTLDWTFGGGATLNCVTLPIELLKFEGKPENNKVILSWDTQTETQNDYFTIEHSTDGQNYTELGHVPGAGTSSQGHTYTMPDYNPAQGINYYRLYQTDFDGRRTMAGTIPVMFNSNAMAMEVYPVPATESITLKLNYTADAAVMVYITDVTGRVVYAQQLQVEKAGSQYTLPLHSLGKGVYFVQGYNLKSNTKTDLQKIIKE